MEAAWGSQRDGDRVRANTAQPTDRHAGRAGQRYRVREALVMHHCGRASFPARTEGRNSTDKDVGSDLTKIHTVAIWK